MKPKKQPPDHKDRIGKSINVDSCVAFHKYNNMSIGVVKKLNPKMIKIAEVGQEPSPWRKDRTYSRYSDDCILLEGPEVTLYLLKQNKS